MDVKGTIKRQPVIAVGVVTTAVAATIGATNAFGLTAISKEQGEALVAAIVAMWPLLLVIWALVTPAAAPQLPAGTDVKLPDGGAGTVLRTS